MSLMVVNGRLGGDEALVGFVVSSFTHQKAVVPSSET